MGRRCTRFVRIASAPRRFSHDVDRTALETTGLGGGEWSPKDLIGHLAVWEQHALDAIAAWDRGERPPIADALETLGTDEVNRRAVRAKAALTLETVRSDATRTHAALLDAIESFDEESWSATPEADSGRSRGQHIGSILGGALGLFRHDPDHWADLEAFARDHSAP